MAENTYPEAIYALPAYLKYGNVNRDATEQLNLFFADAIDIDFRVQSILGEEEAAEQIAGYKYIIGATPVEETTLSLLEESGVAEGDINIGDIIVYNPQLLDAANNEIHPARFERLFNAANPAFGASGGAIVYVIDEQAFKGYDGEDWKPLGGGVTGPKGDTGDVAVYGRKYLQQSGGGGVNAAGKVYIANSLDGSVRDFVLHKFPTADGTADLTDVFFPFGTASSNNSRNPFVTIVFYNKTNKKTFGVRLKAKSGAASGNNLDFQLAANYTDYSVIISESGAADWTGSNAWNENDEIFVLAIADGVAGNDGSQGDQGQGITYADTIDGELYLQYLDSAGDPIEPAFATGIVSGDAGVTGDPGEVGLYMYFTGGSAKWEDETYPTSLTNPITSTPGLLESAGDMVYANDVVMNELDGVTQDIIILSLVTANITTTQFTFASFGLNTDDISPSGKAYNKFTNKPGTLYFYTEEDEYDIRLRSFVSYNKVAFATDTGSAIVLAGIDYGSFPSSKLLGADGTTGEYGYVLPVVSGTRGIGITYDKVENDTLYLAYIDEDGNTFGSFPTISGIPGDLNPFNIPYSITGDIDLTTGDNSIPAGTVSVTQRDGTTPTRLAVSYISESADDVSAYVNSATLTPRSGFITVFSGTDVADFGLFRYTNAVAGLTLTEFQDLVHSGGNITNISGSSPTGFTLGQEIRFAINTDGRQGFTGEIVGYTFGIEYFSQSSRPTRRSTGEALEIGDKWFDHRTGLEFTFLGASGDTDSVVTHGTSFDPVWVQTNNARSGPRGPRGADGLGFTGSVGATGLNPETSWTNRAYSFRDATYITFQQAYDAVADPAYGLSAPAIAGVRAELVNNWSYLDGATAGYFVCASTTGINANLYLNIPGTNTYVSNTSFNNTTFGWYPVIANRNGPIGNTGARGITGTSVVDARLVGYTLEFDFYDHDTETTTIDVVGNVRGPGGPTGPIGGTDTQYIFNEGGVAGGDDNLIAAAFASGTQPRLKNYAEIIEDGTAPSEVSGVWIIPGSPANASTKFVQLRSSPDTSTIGTIQFDHFYVNGGAVTMLIRGAVDNTEYFFGTDNDATSITYSITGSNPNQNPVVAISLQNETTTNPTEIILPKGPNEYGIMTFRRYDGRIFINYVKYDKVSG
jgi:hypothetical protein